MKYYKPGEVNKTAMASLARQTFGCEPFGWQIATAIAVLEGRDVILDVGTGSGKTLAFSLASVMDKKEIIVIISPLSSLMIEQMDNAPISTVAICREILSRVFWGTSRVLSILNISLLVHLEVTLRVLG